jgi:hypothetical protein
MAKAIINVGEEANDGSGDPIRTAMTKSNDNFTELYDSIEALGDVEASSQITNLTAVNEIKLGKISNANQNNPAFIPFTVTEPISNTMSTTVPVVANDLVNGKLVKTVFSKAVDRYTSGGEIILTLVCNGGTTKYYATKKILFSRVEGGSYDVSESSVGSDEIYESVTVTERTSGNDLFLEVTVTSPYAGITTEEFVRVIGQITYTSVPIFLTASGY